MSSSRVSVCVELLVLNCSQNAPGKLNDATDCSSSSSRAALNAAIILMNKESKMLG